MSFSHVDTMPTRGSQLTSLLGTHAPPGSTTNSSMYVAFNKSGPYVVIEGHTRGVAANVISSWPQSVQIDPRLAIVTKALR